MSYNPELVKQLLGDSVAELFNGTIKVAPNKTNFISYGNLKVGDTLVFKLKDAANKSLRQFIVTGKYLK
jgi:hypothetical protein